MGRTLRGAELAAFMAQSEDFGPQFERFQSRPKPRLRAASGVAPRNKQAAACVDATDQQIRAQLTAGFPLAAIQLRQVVSAPKARLADGEPAADEVLHKVGLTTSEIAAYHERERQRCLRLAAKIDGRHDRRAYQGRKLLHGILQGCLQGAGHPEAGLMARQSLARLLSAGAGPVQAQMGKLLLRRLPDDELAEWLLPQVMEHADAATLLRIASLSLNPDRDQRVGATVLPQLMRHAPLPVLLDEGFRTKLFDRMLRNPEDGRPELTLPALRAMQALPEWTGMLIDRTRQREPEAGIAALGATMTYVRQLELQGGGPLSVYCVYTTKCNRQLGRLPRLLNMTDAERARVNAAFEAGVVASLNPEPASAAAAKPPRPAGLHPPAQPARLPVR